MNSSVVLRDRASGELETYTLVFREDADIAQGRLSVLALVGTAILGQCIGDELKWRMPDGLRSRLSGFSTSRNAREFSIATSKVAGEHSVSLRPLANVRHACDKHGNRSARYLAKRHDRTRRAQQFSYRYLFKREFASRVHTIQFCVQRAKLLVRREPEGQWRILSSGATALTTSRMVIFSGDRASAYPPPGPDCERTNLARPRSCKTLCK